MIRYFRCVWSVSIVKADTPFRVQFIMKRLESFYNSRSALCSLWSFVIVVTFLASKFLGHKGNKECAKDSRNSTQGLLTTRDTQGSRSIQ